MPYYVETAPAVLDYIESLEDLSNKGRAAVVDVEHMTQPLS